MTRERIIELTLNAIHQLPNEKAEEISVFAAFVLSRFEENQIAEGIHKLTEESSAFNFLNEEEELYTFSDLKEVYNDKG